MTVSEFIVGQHFHESGVEGCGAQVISISKGIESELAVRKEKAWRSYWSLKGIFKGNMSTRSKIRVLEMCVMPVLCYGAQTWALTKSQVEGLRVTQRTTERSILKIKKRDKIKNRDIRGQTPSTDVGYKIKKAKFQYAGHIIRSERERWTKILTESRPYERKRSKGRPKTRWRDELERRVGKFWHGETQDRKNMPVNGMVGCELGNQLIDCIVPLYYIQYVCKNSQH
jgi:hypothetical protein